jgi:hypothetical protein
MLRIEIKDFNNHRLLIFPNKWVNIEADLKVRNKD